jgi:hypothetical protein
MVRQSAQECSQNPQTSLREVMQITRSSDLIAVKAAPKEADGVVRATGSRSGEDRGLEVVTSHEVAK